MSVAEIVRKLNMMSFSWLLHDLWSIRLSVYDLRLINVAWLVQCHDVLDICVGL